MIISISTTAMASSRQFTGGLGMAYKVETSTNLTAWTSLGTITNTTRTMSFVDPRCGESTAAISPCGLEVNNQ